MRSDMHKVIVERPRYGGRTARKGRVPRNPDSLPSREGMRKPYGYFQAQLMHGMVGCMVSIADMADRAPRVLANNEVVDIGGKRIRYIDTPHVPHGWDAGVIFEETTGTLLCGDLFTQIGNRPSTDRSRYCRAGDGNRRPVPLV